MGFLKKTYISVLMICISFSVINAEDKKDDEVSESYWDKVTDMVPTKKIDTILHDISEDVDIDDKEESLIDNIKDTFPDIISKPATYAVQSGSDMIRATLINDKDMDKIARKDIKKLDDNQTIAKDIDQYYLDLQKVMKKIDIPKDLKLDVKVYLSPFLYIFSWSNGVIRVNSGIIEALDDNELLFLMAHEVAHIENKDYKGSYRKAHAMFAVEKAINMAGEAVSSVSNGLLDSVTSSMRKARFQKDEEFKADEYALSVLKKNGIKKKAAVDALEYLQYMNAPYLLMHPTGHERIKHIKDDL
jgi:putative metalloprotease